MLGGHDCCFLRVIFFMPSMEIKQAKTRGFPKFNWDHHPKIKGPSKVQCDSHPPWAVIWVRKYVKYKNKAVIETWWWLNTDKWDSNWEPRFGPSKLSFDLKMRQDIHEFKLKKEICNAQYTLGFIWHPQLKLPFRGTCVYVSKECNWVWKLSPILPVQTCDFSSLSWNLLESVLMMTSIYQGALPACSKVLI